MWGGGHSDSHVSRKGSGGGVQTEILPNYRWSRLDPEQFPKEVLPHPQEGQEKKKLEIQIIFGAWEMRGEGGKAVVVNRNRRGKKKTGRLAGIFPKEQLRRAPNSAGNVAGLD